jgi:EAL domain-containing protein (putative c-di-GMP-specific phosphodiesterase class I)
VSTARDIAGEDKSDRILQSIIELAHFLKFAVVAVGVPDDASGLTAQGAAL